MRISNLLATNSNYTSTSKKLPKNDTDITEKSKDTFNISSSGKDFQSVINSLANENEERTQMVDNIKSQVQNGTYNVSVETVAEKLLSLSYH